MTTTTSRTFSPPKHRTAKGAQRIQDLTAVAAELFLERGFEPVAVDDLIARVGGSRSNVYTHFGGKEGLFKAAMLHLCTEVAKPLEQLRIEGREPSEVLPDFARALVHAGLSPRTLGIHRLLIIEGKRFPDVALAMWTVSYHKVIEILAGWIAQQQEAPDCRLSNKVPARALAQQFVSMVTSDVKLRAIVGLVQLPLPDAEIDRIVSHAVQTFLQGAAAKPTGPGKTIKCLPRPTRSQPR